MLIVFLSPKKKLALDIQPPKLEVFGAPKHTAQKPNLRRVLDVQGCKSTPLTTKMTTKIPPFEDVYPIENVDVPMSLLVFR